MPIQHIAPTIAALADPWFLGPTLGPKYGQILTDRFGARGDQQAVDDALALGGYLIHSEANKRQRHALRAVILAAILVRNQPVAVAAQLREQFKGNGLDELKGIFTHQFPAFLDGANRGAWDPNNFTNPSTLPALLRPADWRVQAVPQYQFFVHTLKHPSDVLNDPVRTLSGWLAISMSVLDSTKPIGYSNHGVILRVPANNVLTTSPTDQWFDNYAGTDRSTKAQGQTMAKHIGEKTIMIGGLLTPDQVVDRQGTAQAMNHFAGAAQTPHNEVVVCGIAGQQLPHGMTGALTLAGVFIQTRMDGSMPETYMRSQGKARDIELAVSACARNYHVPLLYLPTTTIP